MIYAVIKTESGFDSSAVSSKGAIGLMQMTPLTFNWLTNEKLDEGLDEGMLYDPETNIRYGVYYLSSLYRKYKNWDTAIAAYNAGPGNVDEWLEIEEYSSNGITLKKIPFKETRNHIKKVNRSLDYYDKLYND